MRVKVGLTASVIALGALGFLLAGTVASGAPAHRSGWTATIRPPVSYTNALKVQQMMQYGETGSPSGYEEDHFIPLELGGAPQNPKNLWPEPRSQSKLSDPLETQLKRKVCKGVMNLAKARAAIRLFKNTQG